MIKKTLTILCLTIISLTAHTASAWYKYPVYRDVIDQVVETSTRVYYLSGGNLFSFEPQSEESYSYSNLNVLNDNDVASIYYNPEKKYLVVVYTNSNIDLLYDNGDVVNLPDIKDSSLSVSKTINYVAFGSDRIAVATDFGIVIYSDVRHEVIESGIYNVPITGIGIMDGRLLIFGGKYTDWTIMMSPLEMRHNNLDKFSPLAGYGAQHFEVVDDRHILVREVNAGRIVLRKVDFDRPGWDNIDLHDTFASANPLRRSSDMVYTYTDDKIITFAAGGDFQVYDIPEALKGENVAFLDDPNIVWTASPEGIGRYVIGGENAPTVLYNKMLYDGYTTAKTVGYMRWSADGERLYISNLENSLYRSYAYGDGSPNYQTTNVVEGTRVTDVSLKNASATHKYNLQYQEQFGNKRLYADPTWIMEDPDDPEKYYCGTYFDGLYVIKLNPETDEYEEIGHFTCENSPITNGWGDRVQWVDTDRDGNLWVGFQYGDNFMTLPAEKRRQDPSTITVNDWVVHSKLKDLDYSQHDMQAVMCKKSNMLFYSMALYKKGFIAVDTKGTYLNPDDDEVMQWSKVTDQDGNDVSFEYITFFLEDNRGCVWVGTSSGVFEITNPEDATSYNMTVRRIKVPRNDGTNYADYLLDSDQINYMALDPAGRKWITTESSGLFLVSETGDEIIRQYDTSNSPLPYNTVCSVECDPKDNTVYVGTPTGLYSFKSDAAPGQADYSNILAYPNPVRPEYLGVVTISGLMNKSVVKIANAQGNVVYETRSQGGMATWDVCDSGGERVPNGVYYVYVSESDGSTSSGAVTKILVIN